MAVPATDVLIAMMGAPHESDLTTTVFRLTQALLARGARVGVWACGYATMLSQETLGDGKPRNPAAWSVEYPSTAALVQELLAAFPATLDWYGCRFCSDDRGAAAHVQGVRLRPPGRFVDHVASAGTVLYVGVM
jgi:hypothetical protein